MRCINLTFIFIMSKYEKEEKWKQKKSYSETF